MEREAEHPGGPIALVDSDGVATWADVRAIVRALPETAEASPRQWRVKGKLLAWERPLRRADLEALGKNAPTGDILGAWVPDLDTKEALLSARPRVYFTTPHFDGYPAVLVRLSVIGRAELRELLAEAWLDRAPVRVKRAYMETQHVVRARPRPGTPRRPRSRKSLPGTNRLFLRPRRSVPSGLNSSSGCPNPRFPSSFAGFEK